MLNDKWSKYRSEQKDYEDAYNKLQQLIKASNSLTPAPLTHRNNDFISLGKDTNVEIIRYQSNDLVTTNPKSIELATQILKAVKQNTSLTYKELTDVLNTARSLITPSESQKTSEHAQATLAYLHRLNTADSKRFYGLLMALAGVALIAASIALTVFTFGGALPLVLAIIPIAHPLIAVGVVAVTGAALGAVDIKTGLKKREEAESDLIEADSIKLKADLIKFSLISKHITEELETQLKSGALDRLEINEVLSRAFNNIHFPADLNKDIYDSLTKSAKEGLLQSHLQEIAKSMSRAFLDENHHLKPHIKKSLKLIGASQQEEDQAIDGLLQAAVTLYSLAASAHYEKIPEKTDKSKEAFDFSIIFPVNFIVTTSAISKQSLFETSKPDGKLLITDVNEFPREMDRLIDFVQNNKGPRAKDQIEKIISTLDTRKSSLCEIADKTIQLNLPEPQQKELESIIIKQLSNQMQVNYHYLINDKNYNPKDIERFKETKPDYEAEQIKGPGSL